MEGSDQRHVSGTNLQRGGSEPREWMKWAEGEENFFQKSKIIFYMYI